MKIKEKRLSEKGRVIHIRMGIYHEQRNYIERSKVFLWDYRHASDLIMCDMWNACLEEALRLLALASEQKKKQSRASNTCPRSSEMGSTFVVGRRRTFITPGRNDAVSTEEMRALPKSC